MKLRKPSILVVNRVSSCLSFFLSASTTATYIFTAPNCTTTIITLEPCASSAEYQGFHTELQDFILRFIKMKIYSQFDQIVIVKKPPKIYMPSNLGSNQKCP
jgi:hypothetical protein